MSDDPVFDLSAFPVHLGLGATAVPQEHFTGDPDWYQRYGERHAGDGVEGRLVALHAFTGSWDSWEMHPNGAEVVVCTAGTITLHQETDGSTTTVILHPGEAVINPAGTWHTADVDGDAAALFITAGLGTEVRAR